MRKFLKGRSLELYDQTLAAVLPDKLQGYLSWRRHWKYDEAMVVKLMGSKGFLKAPNVIPLSNVTELKTNLYPNLYHYNPTLINSQDSLKLFWRMSNYSDSPEMHRMGWKLDKKKNTAGINSLVNGVGSGEVSIMNDLSFLQITNEEIVITPSTDSSCLIAGEAKRSYSNLTFEDPRCVASNKDILILAACDLADAGGLNPKRQQIAVYNLFLK